MIAYLLPHSTTTPYQVASRINELFPYNRPGDPDEHEGATDFLPEFWDVMFRIAPELDYNQEPIQRYVALFKALRDLPEVILEEGKKLAGREGWGDPAECDGRRAWQDLAYFGSMPLEWLYRIRRSPEPNDESNRR